MIDMRRMTDFLVGDACEVGLKISTRNTEILIMKIIDNCAIQIDDQDLREV